MGVEMTPRPGVEINVAVGGPYASRGRRLDGSYVGWGWMVAATRRLLLSAVLRGVGLWCACMLFFF